MCAQCMLPGMSDQNQKGHMLSLLIVMHEYKQGCIVPEDLCSSAGNIIKGMQAKCVEAGTM